MARTVTAVRLREETGEVLLHTIKSALGRLSTLLLSQNSRPMGFLADKVTGLQGFGPG